MIVWTFCFIMLCVLSFRSAESQVDRDMRSVMRFVLAAFVIGSIFLHYQTHQ